jgi:hypothetical protein
MPEKELEIMHYIKNENNSDILYLVAVTCLDRLVKMDKAATIKAVLDSGTTSLCKMNKTRP